MQLFTLVKRNTKLFFKDKALFFVAMISPLVLLVLFATFLGGIYRTSFTSAFTESGITISDGLIDGAVIAYLVSSLLSVSCVTVAFCCNVMSIQDKINRITEDFKSTPVSKVAIAMSYFIATFLVSLLICLIILGLSFVLLAIMGQFYFSISDIFSIILDVAILSLFGSVLSSIICHFCSSQAQMGAITGIISSCYGFLCGAYMPISQFASGIQAFISALPGTFGTSLLKNHMLTSYLTEMHRNGATPEIIDGLRSGFDLNLTAFGNNVEIPVMYLVLIGTIGVIFAIFLILSVKTKSTKNR